MSHIWPCSWAFDHLRAAHHGCRAGRAGLSLEEVGDTGYLIRLRRSAQHDIAEIADQLDQELAALDAAPPDPVGDVVRARRDALIAKAKATAQCRIADYELLCASYGASWRRHHRDRRIARLGWRCPKLTDAEEVIGREHR